MTNDIHSMGVYSDRKTGEPYVYIHFSENTLVDVHSLPKHFDGVDIRYVKSKIAQS